MPASVARCALYGGSAEIRCGCDPGKVLVPVCGASIAQMPMTSCGTASTTIPTRTHVLTRASMGSTVRKQWTGPPSPLCDRRRQTTLLELLLMPTDGKGRQTGLAGALRDAVASGQLPRGTRLPSTRALAAELGWARATVVGRLRAARRRRHPRRRSRSGHARRRRRPTRRSRSPHASGPATLGATTPTSGPASPIVRRSLARRGSRRSATR